MIRPLAMALDADRGFDDATNGGKSPAPSHALSGIKHHLDTVIAAAFPLPARLFEAPELRSADHLALAIEMHLLMPSAGITFPGLPPLPPELPTLPVRDQPAAQNQFLIRALTLIQARHGLGPEWQVRHEPAQAAAPEAPAC